ncbi:biotin-independent malonate decarboxylase subunit gamma [Massilia sp. W12]|uniref:biotin-independent malonate decarboxylase subunit gamma n=1 Tax=Massilia sp. W12 TaxID=3126507 RepID=UPI0030D2175E
MNWQTLCAALFPDGHQISAQAEFLQGSAQVDGQTLYVIGTCEGAEIGVELALRQAQAVLQVVQNAPRAPILLLVDTVGQRLRLRDEMLAINGYMAHLAKCVQYAREQGHLVLALVYSQALSGGFLSSGLMAQACYALPDVSIRVMDLQAMARITKLPLAELQELARHNPVFAPGAANYWQMGGLQAIWSGDLASALRQALQAGDAAQDSAQDSAQDQRPALGAARGGRLMAQQVIDLILQDRDDATP